MYNSKMIHKDDCPKPQRTNTLPPWWQQQEWKGCCMAKKRFHLSMPLFVSLPDS